MPDNPIEHPATIGCVQVYTGNGKGKTTAALGLCLRAVGAGLRVYIAQFMKAGEYSELKALKRLGDQVTLAQFGTGRFVRGKPSEEDRLAARRGYQAARDALGSGHYQMVILDESMVALHLGLLTEKEINGLMAARGEGVELVLTGRSAPPEILDQADLVTEMREVKHYYHDGVPARVGIEK